MSKAFVGNAMKARKMLVRGCISFLAHVINKAKSNPSKKKILVVQEFPDIFVENLPSLALE